MRIYVVFGEYTERLCQHLSSRYEIVGSDRTLEAAVAAIKNLPQPPDAFLVLGSALASGMVGGRIDHGAALIHNLKGLRKSCPASRVVVVLSLSTSDSLVQGIAKLGIYDVHRVEEVTPDTLCALIESRKTFADYDIDLKVTGGVGETSRVAVREPEEKAPRPSVKEIVARLARLVPRPSRAVPVLLTPDGDVSSSVALTAPVLVFCSPWAKGAGVTALVVETGKILAGRAVVALIDADFENPSLAARLGLPLEEIWPYDWRREPVAFRLEKRLYVFPLDPFSNLSPVPVGEVISAAKEFVDLILVDAGANPELNAPGTRVLVVNERVEPDAVRAWEFYHPFSEGVVVAVGNGSFAASFGLPVLRAFRNTLEAARALAAAWQPAQIRKKGVLSR